MCGGLRKGESVDVDLNIMMVTRRTFRNDELDIWEGGI